MLAEALYAFLRDMLSLNSLSVMARVPPEVLKPPNALPVLLTNLLRNHRRGPPRGAEGRGGYRKEPVSPHGKCSWRIVFGHLDARMLLDSG